MTRAAEEMADLQVAPITLHLKTMFWRFLYTGEYGILSTIQPDFKRVQNVFRETAASIFLHLKFSFCPL